MESLFWGRTDYQDLNYRMTPEGHLRNQWPEWVWQGSQSLGASANVFAGQLTTHNYGAPMNWDNTGGAIQDNPSRHDYNLDEMVDKFIASALELQKTTGRFKHQLWPCGSDFQYQNADHWFHNLDKIMHYVNINAMERGGPVVAFYRCLFFFFLFCSGVFLAETRTRCVLRCVPLLELRAHAAPRPSTPTRSTRPQWLLRPNGRCGPMTSSRWQTKRTRIGRDTLPRAQA